MLTLQNKKDGDCIIYIKNEDEDFFIEDGIKEVSSHSVYSFVDECGNVVNVGTEYINVLFNFNLDKKINCRNVLMQIKEKNSSEDLYLRCNSITRLNSKITAEFFFNKETQKNATNLFDLNEIKKSLKTTKAKKQSFKI